MSLKLFPKFFLLLTILVVIPAAIVGWRTININREGMQAAILELHTNIASSLADDVEDYLKSLDREIQYVQQTLTTQMTWLDRQSVLQTLLDTNENLVSVSIVNRQGDELLKAYNPVLEKNPKLILRSQDKTFRDFWKSPNTSSISSVYFSANNPRINIIYPLGEEHCLFTTITLQTLWDKIVNTRIASTGYAFLVNDKGTIIAHPQIDLVRNKTDAKFLPIVNQVLKAVTVGSSEYVHPQNKKEIVGAYAPVKGLKWGIIIQQDKDEAYVSVKIMQRQAIVLILISLALAMFLVFFIARDLTKPLVTLTNAARRIANKDFKVRVKVNTRDELQDLAETFNDMSQELQRYDEMQVDKILMEKTKIDAVIVSIHDGILMIDLEGLLQLTNTKAKELLGLPENWHNKSLWNCIKDTKIKDTLFEVINLSERGTVKELNLSDENVSRYYQLMTEDVITTEKREVIGIVVVMHDVTLEKELDKMKDDFLHSITHDLRNPVTSIRGFLKFLLDGIGGPINEKQRKMLETMSRASERLIGLINDILDIAKLEFGQIHLELAETDTAFICQKVIELAEPQAVRKFIKLTLDVQGNIPKITADPKLLERVFTNLVGNALKFTPDKGEVTIKLEDSPEYIKGAVIDTGEGIPPEYVEKIFDKFQQVIGQRRGGTGLGLTICKHIIEAHSGKIWVESKLKQGSAFKFTISKNIAENQINNSKEPDQSSKDKKDMKV
ncbi:MAG: HAMP domain-containing protein [Endomicrobiales bacterium]|nr:HAMP domain-containing protein [Endomicrobiales bacterium]